MDGFDEFDDYEELTPEELEQERRRKAAARRRRQEARELRRRKRRQEAIIRCTILLVAVILVVVGIVKIISGIASGISHKKASKTSEEVVTEEATEEEVIANIDESILAKDWPADRETALSMIKEKAETDNEYKDIYDNQAVFSDDLLRCVAVNPEMKRFVIDYIAKISIVFEGNFTLTVPENEVPLYLQFDEQWGYADYGPDIIALSGSAPTCLSMAYTYLKKDGTQNPIKIADMGTEYGYLTEEGATSAEFLTDGAAKIGILSTPSEMNKDTLVNALDSGKLVICKVGSGDFTKTTSYILLKAYKQGLFLINDPGSEARSLVGWDFSRLESQTEAVWILEDGGEIPTEEPVIPEDTPEDTGGDDGDGETNDDGGDGAAE